MIKNLRNFLYFTLFWDLLFFSVSNMFIASTKSWKRQNFSMKKVLHQWYHSLSKIESCGICNSFQLSDFLCICFPGISLELAEVRGLKLIVAYYKLSHEQSNVEPSEALITYVLKPTSPRKVNVCTVRNLHDFGFQITDWDFLEVIFKKL